MIRNLFLLLFTFASLSCFSSKEVTLHFVIDKNIDVREINIYFNYLDEPIKVSDINIPFSFPIDKEGSFKIEVILENEKKMTSSEQYMTPMIEFSSDVIVSDGGVRIENVNFK